MVALTGGEEPSPRVVAFGSVCTDTFWYFDKVRFSCFFVCFFLFVCCFFCCLLLLCCALPDYLKLGLHTEGKDQFFQLQIGAKVHNNIY